MNIDRYRKLIVSLYEQQSLTLDMLPYTDQFDWMLNEFCCETHADVSPADFWRALVRIRKGGYLPNKVKANTSWERKRQAEKLKEQTRGGLGL